MSGHALLQKKNNPKKHPKKQKQKKKKKTLMFLFEGVKRIVDCNTCLFFTLWIFAT